MTRHQTLTRRLDRVLWIQRRDVNRFKPSPLGPGFLTRQERYLELIWEIERQLDGTTVRMFPCPR